MLGSTPSLVFDNKLIQLTESQDDNLTILLLSMINYYS